MDDRPLDPRQQRTRERVLAAARCVLRHDGVRGATMDAIAVEAGVARSTLYRNWDGLPDLLDDAIGDVVTPPAEPHEPGPLARLRAIIEQLAVDLDRSEWGELLPSIVAAIDASPEIAARYGAFVDGQRRIVRRIIRDAVASGALPTGVNPDDLVDDLVGPLFYRRLVRRVPTPVAWARRHTDRTLAATAVRA